jgi:phosphate transport system permease protein
MQPGPGLYEQLLAPRAWSERLLSGALFLCAATSVLTTAGILLVLLGETWAFFGEVSIVDFLSDTQWTPLFADAHFGILPLLAGTLLTSAIALATALPLGILAAVYLSEFASRRARAWLKPTLELLAGIPTVVYGYFALTAITPALKLFIPGLAGSNALSAGLVMGVMITPLIASLSEDAIFSVPQSLRESAYALGATKPRAIFGVVLPAASSGIAAAVILGVSRAVGETMIVAIAAGQQPTLTVDPRQPIETMTAFIVQVSLGDTPAGTLEYKTIFAVGFSLFVITLAFNLYAQRLRARFRRGAR